MRYKYLFIVLLILFCRPATAAVFIVTSNADSGPGTLREALTLAAANGSAEKDFINFNLPDLSEAGRTIMIFSSLPNISSDLIIDGTTQPGNKFGVSDAKIIIESGGTENFSCLVINNETFGSYISNIEIYGLYIRNFKKKPLLSSVDYGAVGIRVLRQCKNLVIGALGKGNVICGTHIAIGSTPDSYDGIFEGSITGVSVQCNIIGVAEDGKTANSNFTGISLIIEGGQALIGGSLPSLGNIVAANGTEIFAGQYPDPSRPFTTGNTAIIENNRIGTGVGGTESYITHFVGESPLFDLNYPFLGIQTDLRECFVSLKNNIISGHTNNNVIIRASRYEIKGNKIGTDITTTLDLGNGRNVSLEENATGIVGGDDEADKNVIAFGKQGAIYGQSMVINKNSFYCNQDFSINQNDKTFAPAPVIKSVTNLAVAGTAKPGALIQLYYTADCTLCEGKNFIAKVNANTDGSWVYHGSITRSIIATATIDNSATSEFSVPYLNVAINESQQETKAATCTNAADGYIKNIIIENIGSNGGPYTYTWRNENGETVGNALNLVNVPKGLYTLEIKGASCGSAFTNPIPVGSKEIVIDLTSVQKSNAGCNKANGSIIGITAPQATKFEWRNAGNNLVGTKAALDGVPAGTYFLTASNESGCSKTTGPYEILEIPGTVFPSTYTVNHIDACFGKANGALQVNQDILIKAVRWVNAAGVNVALHHGATDLPAGGYKLYLTDQNGCESYYNTYRVDQLPELKVTDNGQTGNEQCGLKSGYVSNVTVAGGLPPYTYTWLNANGTSIGAANSISNLSAGTYTLNIADSRCGSINVNYQIQNIPQNLAAPSVSDIQVCSPGDAILLVNDAGADVVYRLYNQADSASPLTEQKGGRFKIAVTTNRSFFVSQVNGTCESPKTGVKVSVGLSPLSIANSFTPNGDGSNDYWKISNIESYPAAVVQVFNRNGQKLFESKGYTTPFNGTYNGKALPVGTYYYIINLNKNCNLLSGSLTILR